MFKQAARHKYMAQRKGPQPGPGQESVWDYPRPPRVEESSKHIQVVFNGTVIADTHRAMRVLETSHPPVYYIPPEDVKMEYFTPTPRHTYCEFKGQASYYTIRVGDKSVPMVHGTIHIQVGVTRALPIT